MNNSKSVDHPWRTRTREFAHYLQDIPPDEKRRIQAAERGFLSECGQPHSLHVRAMMDFAASMVGAQETVDEE
jgi:hypothetical protein